MIEQWNVGVLGTGLVVEASIIPALSALENVRISAVCSASGDEARATKAAEQVERTAGYLPEKFTGLTQMLQKRRKLDAVFIATSSGKHSQHAVECLNNKKRVILEKPPAMNLPQLLRIAQASALNRMPVGCIFQYRLNDVYSKLRRAVEAGRFGQIAFAQALVPWSRKTKGYYDLAPWRGTPEEDGGAMMNQGIHYLDLLLWLMQPAQNLGLEKEPVTALTAIVNNVAHKGDIRVEDIGAATFQFRNGAVGSYVASTACGGLKPGEAEIFISGTTGTVRIANEAITRWDFTVPAEEDEQITISSPGAGGASKDPKAIDFRLHARNIALCLDWFNGDFPGLYPDFSFDLFNAGRTGVIVDDCYRSAQSLRISMPSDMQIIRKTLRGER